MQNPVPARVKDSGATKSPQLMVVEDEGIVAADIVKCLHRLGFPAVTAVSSGEEALETLQNYHPDLVLMDITLSGKLDGIETAMEIRERSDTPVIYLTAHGDGPTVARAKLTGPHGYLLKPFDDRSLRAAVETALHKATLEQSLREHQEWLDAILKGIGDAVIVTDRNGCITFMNPVAEIFTGYKGKDAVSKPIADVVRALDEDSHHPVESSALKAIRSGRPANAEAHVVLESRDGGQTCIEETASPIMDSEGAITGAVLILRDTSERRRHEAELQALSLMDDLTGLYNRRGLTQVARTMLRLAARNGADVDVFCIDVDSLKQINDNFGHSEGDRAIVRTAEILKNSFRSSDVLARLGGDEFVALATSVCGNEKAIMDRLEEELKKDNERCGGKYVLSFSVGVCRSEAGDGLSLEDLMSRADKVLYAKKRDKMRFGGNRAETDQGNTLKSESAANSVQPGPGRYRREALAVFNTRFR